MCLLQLSLEILFLQHESTPACQCYLALEFKQERPAFFIFSARPTFKFEYLLDQDVLVKWFEPRLYQLVSTEPLPGSVTE